jgi:hypothetical protein
MPPLDELYLRWLYSLVANADAQDKSQTYWRLLKQLFTTEFLWLIPNDDNRLEDGKALRREFLAAQAIDERDVDPDWIELGCSVLELMVGLSRRLEFEADGQPHYWFWVLMENIGLRDYNDGVRRYPKRHIDDVLHSIIFRQYNRHGLGGFFPLRGPCDDQRNVELWYQLSAYVLERT